MDRPDRLIDLDIRLRRAGLFLVYLVIGVAIWMILREARPAIEFILTVLSPFMVALIVAYIFNPIVTWLQARFHLGRIGGVVITYILILAITAGFFALLIPTLYGQLRAGIMSGVAHFPHVVDKATHWLQLRVSPDEMEQARQFLRRNFDPSVLTGRAGQVTENAFDTTKLVTRLIGTAISVVIGGIAFIAFVVVICFYFLLDYHNMEHVTRVLLPEDTESKVFHIWHKIDRALGGYLRGQLIVAATIGTIYAVVLSFMGMREYAVLIGFMAGIGNMIPYTGPIIGGVPAALWIIFGDTYGTTESKMLGVGGIVALSVFAQTLDGLFLQPRIVGKSAELHPLLVMLALLVGAQFGLGGMIIAVPLAVMARVALKELWWDPMERQEFENKRKAGAIHAAANPETYPAVPRTDMSLPVVIQPIAPEPLADLPPKKRRRRRKPKHG